MSWVQIKSQPVRWRNQLSAKQSLKPYMADFTPAVTKTCFTRVNNNNDWTEVRLPETA